MKRLMILALAMMVACAPKPPKPPAPPPHYAVQVFVTDAASGAWVGDGATIRTDATDVANQWTSGVGPAGARADQFLNAGWNACAKAPNYPEQCLPVATFPGSDPSAQFPGDVVLRFKLNYVAPPPIHVDPSQFTLEQLSHIKGSMWTARLNLPYGPRPGQDDNILAMDFYQLYGKADRARMIEAYRARGYTHAVTGPLAGGDCYHGQYPCNTDLVNQEQFDAYLDAMQEWWDAGIIPVHFVHPDGWTLDQMQQLEKLYSQPRAQRLLRVVVPTGWEPWKYEIPNSEWVKFEQWGQRVFPNSLRLIHLVADTDAPTGADDDKTLPGGNAQAWANVVPYIHGWLVQSCGYACQSNPVPSAEFIKNFSDLFNINTRGSLTDRFQHGYAGWPTSSAWGQNKPLIVYAGEFAAYGDYWNNFPEAQSLTLGDLAISVGAGGSLDGCKKCGGQ